MRLLPFLLLLCTSCSLFNGYRRHPYTSGPEGKAVTLVLPKGWKRVEQQQNADGNRTVYDYGGGTFIYLSSRPFGASMHIDHRQHLPKTDSLRGGLIFKGMDSTGCFYRELRYPNLYIGYVGVNSDYEARFDSALNYAAIQLRGGR
ncbi:MAG TPA: hypothetical protein VHK69_14980 [Chitinophagaceae bacterium]|jgi:hypothetical protein|nr:hypothetical protein [Chitinophagaceae bacterium]